MPFTPLISQTIWPRTTAPLIKYSQGLVLLLFHCSDLRLSFLSLIKYTHYVYCFNVLTKNCCYSVFVLLYLLSVFGGFKECIYPYPSGLFHWCWGNLAPVSPCTVKLNGCQITTQQMGIASITLCILLGIHCMTKKSHDDAMTWKHFPNNWPFVWNPLVTSDLSTERGNQWSALFISLLLVCTSHWTNNGFWLINSDTWCSGDIIVMSQVLLLYC